VSITERRGTLHHSHLALHSEETQWRRPGGHP
jgi:hypothetical protein